MSARRLLALATMLALASAAAWELRVDDTGGPGDLAERVEAAVDAWRSAGADVDSVERTVLVRYASGDLMGPDAVSLVVTGGPPGVDLEILLRADASELLDDALIVAVGVALGGTPGVGVLEGRLVPDEDRRPSEADVTALAPGRSLPGDVTGDGSIGFADLLALAEAWGSRGVNLAADLDGDGEVGDSDLEILRENYTFRPLAEEQAPETPPAEADAPPEAADPGEEGEDEAADPAEEGEDDAEAPVEEGEDGTEDPVEDEAESGGDRPSNDDAADE